MQRHGIYHSRTRLTHVVRAFLVGFEVARSHPNLESVIQTLDLMAPDWRGFAYEGAGMALALLDYLSVTPTHHLERFLDHPSSDRHVYLVYTGSGWARAKLNRCLTNTTKYPLYRWLAWDGWGFHDGYFGRPAAKALSRLTGYQVNTYYQGKGRSLWFTQGAHWQQIVKAINNSPSDFRADLWAGVGLACAYAGGIGLDEMRRLIGSTGTHFPAFAQGVAFAATARLRDSSVNDEILQACELCGLSPHEARKITDNALNQIHDVDGPQAYQTWQFLIRRQFEARE